jgi:sulfur-carrier protein
MSIEVRYFASLAELIGRAESSIAYTPGMTVLAVWQADNPDREIPANTLVAINMEYADLGGLLQDRDEVAFFPPVTGGQP